MPLVETYGAQPPIELLRQLLDSGGMYDRDKLFFKELADTLLLCAAAPPGGGRSALSQRFTRHFHVLCVPPAADASLSLIFGSILNGFLASFQPDVCRLGPGAVSATIELYQQISKQLLPTPGET
jgi:dynein heavy chain